MCSSCSGDYEDPAMTQPEESDAEMDLRLSGSFAASQARLARAIESLTASVGPHLEGK